MFKEELLSAGQAIQITDGPEGSQHIFRKRLCDDILVISNWVKNEDNNNWQPEANQSGRQTGISLLCCPHSPREE